MCVIHKIADQIREQEAREHAAQKLARKKLINELYSGSVDNTDYGSIMELVTAATDYSTTAA